MPNFTSAWPRTLIAGSNNITPEDRSGQGHAVHGLAYGKAKNFPSDARKLENRLKRQKGGYGFYRITGIPRAVSS